MNTFTHRNLTRLAAPALALVALTACTTMGIGTGSTRNNDVTAAFAWKSTDDHTGSLTANLNNGETFTGKFFQITSESRVEEMGPLWGGWHRGWGGWAYWDRMPSDAFVTHYSGKVVANLDGPNAEHMRCRFTLITPTAGLAGGGEGRCQLPSGKNINATFPRA
jgi:hypothetical protein